jgi:hypothetical protein
MKSPAVVVINVICIYGYTYHMTTKRANAIAIGCSKLSKPIVTAYTIRPTIDSGSIHFDMRAMK